MPDQEPKVGATGGTDSAASGEKPAVATAEPVSKAELAALEQRLTATVSQAIDGLAPRLKQSQKDVIEGSVKRNVREAFQGFDSAAEALAPYLKEGTNVPEVKQRLAMQLLADELLGQGEREPAPQGRSQGDGQSPNPLQAEIIKMLTDRGLSGKEPELVDFLGQSKGKPFYQVVRELDDLTNTLVERAKPDPSKILGGGTGGNAPPPADLVAEYRKEMLAARGKGAMAGREIREKYAKLGVPVDTTPIIPTTSRAN